MLWPYKNMKETEEKQPTLRAQQVLPNGLTRQCQEQYSRKGGKGGIQGISQNYSFKIIMRMSHLLWVPFILKSCYNCSLYNLSHNNE